MHADIDTLLCAIPNDGITASTTRPYNSSQLAADQNTVVASLNYRVGPLGFAAFPEDKAAGKTTGNWGMLDMQEALRWVQREIHHFGGDKNRVAIFGQSSGGEAVELLALAPSSAGLLRGSISQSGGVSARTFEDAAHATHLLGKRVGCKDSATLKVRRIRYICRFLSAPPLSSVSLLDAAL